MCCDTYYTCLFCDVLLCSCEINICLGCKYFTLPDDVTVCQECVKWLEENSDKIKQLKTNIKK